MLVRKYYLLSTLLEVFNLFIYLLYALSPLQQQVLNSRDVASSCIQCTVVILVMLSLADISIVILQSHIAALVVLLCQCFSFVPIDYISGAQPFNPEG